jgi:hypothetical protein
VRQELEKVTASIAAVAAAAANSAASSAATPPTAAAVATTTQSKGEIHTKIKNLEAARDAIPTSDTELAPHREGIESKLKELKDSLNAPKQMPIGARLDAGRAALARALKRREEAELAVAAANSVLEMSVTEVASIEASVAELERALATPAAPQPSNFVEEVSTKLSEMVKFLREQTHVSDVHVAGAEQAVSSLLSGLQNTLMQAEALEEAAKRHRLVGKQPLPDPKPLPVPVPAERHRLNGKQGARIGSTLADFGFKPAKVQKHGLKQDASSGGATSGL